MRRAIGLGNVFRGDDAAGLEIARRLQTECGRTDVIVHEGDMTDLLDLMDGCDDVVIFDAVTSGAPAGTIHLIDATSDPLPTTMRFSTHALGLQDTLQLARITGRLPAKVEIVGIEAGDCGFGLELTPEVAQAIDRLIEGAFHA